MPRPLRVAIVGSRDYGAYDRVATFLDGLHPDSTVISGGARGVDRTAEVLAKRRGLAVEVFPADWDGPQGRGAGFARNTDIVNACEALVAFWDGKSNGTRDSIRKALAQGKPVRVVYPDGRVTRGHEA